MQKLLYFIFAPLTGASRALVNIFQQKKRSLTITMFLVLSGGAMEEEE
jgi:hypothetical protein